MVNLSDLAKNISASLPRIKSGPLRLWGQRFGRPGEDWQTLLACTASENCLRLQLTDNELLAVWNPTDVRIDLHEFRIGSAAEMRFTYYCGQALNPENLRYRDFALRNGLVEFRTNENVVPGSGWLPESTISSHPAVEIGD